MLLSELIQEDLVKMNLEARNKWDAIEELVDLLVGAHELRLANRAEVLDTVFAREKSLSTGLEHGLAVPHGAVECVGDILAAVGLSAGGIPFDSLDGAPARLVVLLVIPRGAAQRHVRTLAGIARLDLAVDGADQVAPDGWILKGGGGAQTRERIVAAAARRFVVIVSSDKPVPRLRAPVPLELLAFGLDATVERLGDVRLRGRTSPDGGHLADWHGEIGDPERCATMLSSTPGVVSHGLFEPELMTDLVVATGAGVEHRRLR